ncbi:hypothetical protein DFJ74DRAFT_326502 [Hyaloraphidium curvatum]|nr:hypothetical protein DFJ74DRAFT_326502 [Hyaloraphidium curvatum]
MPVLENVHADLLYAVLGRHRDASRRAARHLGTDHAAGAQLHRQAEPHEGGPGRRQSRDAARVQLEKLQKHFNDILAEGTMLEIRKGFLADLTKLEAQMAAAERLAKRMAGTATEVQSAAAQEVETAAEMKVVSTVVYFERQLPKPASSYEVTRAAEMSLELKSEQTTPTDLFGDLGSLIAALPRDSSETDLRPLAAASTAEAQPQPEVEAVVVEEASTVVEPQADVVSAPSSADVAEEAAAAVVDEVEMPVEPTSEANGEAAPEATEILATEEQQKQEEAVAEVVAEAAPAEPQAEVQEPEQQAPAVEAVPDVPEPVPESVSVPAATEAPAAEQPQQEAEAVHSEAEATPAPAAVQEQVAQPAAAPASDGVQTESIHKVADLLAKFDPVAGKAATLRSRSISPVGRNLVAAPQMQPNAKSQ